MSESVGKIITNVLQALYQPFIFAIALSFLVVFLVMYLEKYNGRAWRKQLKQAIVDWKIKLKESKKTRRLVYFVFFVAMVLFKTLFIRDMWENPLSDVIGTWGFYDRFGRFTTEIIENVVLFIPLIFFLFFFLETTSKRTSKFLAVMGRAIAISFLSSLAIEMLQLFLRLGTWQLSDLCFNTLGGVIGGLIYWVSAKCRGV